MKYRIVHALRSQVEKTIAKHSTVSNDPFISPKQFPWTKQLESYWLSIRQEVELLMRYVEVLPNFQTISPREAYLTQDDGWKTYFLYAFGLYAKGNCERCPETTKLLRQIPGLQCAFFSILAPGKRIPAHRGLYKGVLRCHLGLIVPQPNHQCWIRVHQHTTYWEEGKTLIFDDTFEHEVHNATDGYRVVLFLDIARPLSAPFSWLNGLACRLFAFTPLVQIAKSNHQHWEKQFEAFVNSAN